MDGDRYQRLLNEHLKVRTQISILKRTLLDNEGKIEQLEKKLKERDHELHKGTQEIDALRFNNKRLTKRIQVLQSELQESGKHQSWILGSGSTEIKRELERCKQTLEVTAEDLQHKILDNERLSEQLADIQSIHDAELAKLRSQNAAIATELATMKEEVEAYRNAIEKQTMQLQKQNKILEKQRLDAEERVTGAQIESNECKRMVEDGMMREKIILQQIQLAITTAASQATDGGEFRWREFVSARQRALWSERRILFESFHNALQTLCSRWLAILEPGTVSDELRKHLTDGPPAIAANNSEHDLVIDPPLLESIPRLINFINKAISLEIQRLGSDSNNDSQIHNTLLESILQTLLSELRSGGRYRLDKITMTLQNLQKELIGKAKAIKINTDSLAPFASAVGGLKDLIPHLEKWLNEQRLNPLITDERNNLQEILEPLENICNGPAVQATRMENESLRQQLLRGSEENRVQLDGLNNQLAGLESRLAAVQQQYKQASQESGAKEDQILKLMSEKERLIERISVAEKERRHSVDVTARLSTDLAGRESALERSMAEQHRLQQELVRVEARMDSVKALLDGKSTELAMEQKKTAQLQSDKHAATLHIELLSAKIAKLELLRTDTLIPIDSSANTASMAVQTTTESSVPPTQHAEQQTTQSTPQTDCSQQTDPQEIRPATQNHHNRLREFYQRQLSSYSDTIHFLQSQLHAVQIARSESNGDSTLTTDNRNRQLEEAYRRISELERKLCDAENRHKRQVGEMFENFVAIQTELENLKKPDG